MVSNNVCAHCGNVAECTKKCDLKLAQSILYYLNFCSFEPTKIGDISYGKWNNPDAIVKGLLRSYTAKRIGYNKGNEFQVESTSSSIIDTNIGDFGLIATLPFRVFDLNKVDNVAKVKEFIEAATSEDNLNYKRELVDECLSKLDLLARYRLVPNMVKGNALCLIQVTEEEAQRSYYSAGDKVEARLIRSSWVVGEHRSIEYTLKFKTSDRVGATFFTRSISDLGKTFWPADFSAIITQKYTDLRVIDVLPNGVARPIRFQKDWKFIEADGLNIYCENGHCGHMDKYNIPQFNENVDVDDTLKEIFLDNKVLISQVRRFMAPVGTVEHNIIDAYTLEENRVSILSVFN